MFIPAVYGVALCMILFSMLAWGSWANVLKLCEGWRFELLYWDYVWGTSIDGPDSWIYAGVHGSGQPRQLYSEPARGRRSSPLVAFLGGVVFNIGNILIVAAIAIAGMAVAFPVGIGLALVIGSVLNYVVTPKGNPLMLFGGIGLICLAILLDARAYRRQMRNQTVTVKGIVVSVIGGVMMGLFYPFIATAIKGEHHLGPYTVAFIFALGILLSNFPLNYILMRIPLCGPPLYLQHYRQGRAGWHLLGIVGGMFWMAGTLFNFVASYAQMVGPAASYALGQGSTMVGTIWGVFVWKEFKGADKTTRWLLAFVFAFFIVGLACVALAPVVK